MRRLKRLLRATVIFFLLTVIGLAIYRFSGSSAIESWIGTQLLETAGSYLQPQLHFDRLTYLRPRTVVLDNLTLTSPDPANPGKTVVILAVKHARLELAEIPQRGQPIRFSRVTFDTPEVRLISAPQGGLIGYSQFLKGSGGSPPSAAAPALPNPPAPTVAAASAVRLAPAAAPNVASAPTSSPAAPPPPMQVSDFLLIRQLAISHGTLLFDPRRPGKPPILLDDISTSLDFEPKDRVKNPALYSLATTLTRAPAIEAHLKGVFDINALSLDVESLDFTVDVQEKNVRFLPSELQELIKDREISGQLKVRAAGTAPFKNLGNSSLDITTELTDAGISMGESRYSIDKWSGRLSLAALTLTIQKSDAKLLGGSLQLSGVLPFTGSAPAQITMAARDVKIEKLLRTLKPGETPKYAGNVEANITYSAPLSSWNTQAAGNGTVVVRGGKIDRVPGLGDIFSAVGNSLKLSTSAGTQQPHDAADARFTFAGNAIQIDELTGTVGSLAFRIKGSCGFDQALDLRLNAGPLETLQKVLGPLGKFWGDVSDAVAGYRVSGTLSEPKVSVEVGLKLP